MGHFLLDLHRISDIRLLVYKRNYMINEKDLNSLLSKTAKAQQLYAGYSYHQRATLMHAIADALWNDKDRLIETAAKETHLSDTRLQVELKRTCFQLKSYADAVVKGIVLDNTIDYSSHTNGKQINIRKAALPIGIVVVFGASNFPFAYSTPGGDTASALAAGCAVVVKAHPAHPETSASCAAIIQNTIRSFQLPEALFTHIADPDIATGVALVKHPLVRAVGFTGSYAGGRALYDAVQTRKDPIPLFAEMGSVNPVFLFPNQLGKAGPRYAEVLADSITGSCGQFCTQPGLIIGLDTTPLQQLVTLLTAQLNEVKAAKMLHEGIAKSFREKRAQVLTSASVNLLTQDRSFDEQSAIPTLLLVQADEFIQQPALREEVFGPYSVIVQCSNEAEMKAVAALLHGQITATIIANSLDVETYGDTIQYITELGGRIIWNGVPTGVEVCLSMHHGGEFPASTDARFTSVGADAVKRFVKMKTYQNFPDELLPPSLQNENPWGIWRRVNNEYTDSALK